MNVIDISSRDFYKSHSLSWFCSAKVADGKIKLLYEETGYDGGELWSLKNRANGTLQSCLSKLGATYGMRFYEATRKAAYKEKLKSSEKVAREHKEFLIYNAEKEVAKTKAAYEVAKTKLSRMEEDKSYARRSEESQIYPVG